MLTDWEYHRVPRERQFDMVPRHSDGIKFRVQRISIRRDAEDGNVVIVSFSGARLIDRDVTDNRFLEQWEWDSDRDPGNEQIHKALEDNGIPWTR